jgi:ankyrin repeat protein
VWGCSEPLVVALLQAGADVSYVNDRVFDAWLTVPVGSTPLHLAVVRNHMPIALMLLQHFVSGAWLVRNRGSLLSCSRPDVQVASGSLGFYVTT